MKIRTLSATLLLMMAILAASAPQVRAGEIGGGPAPCNATTQQNCPAPPPGDPNKSSVSDTTEAEGDPSLETTIVTTLLSYATSLNLFG